MCAAYDIYDAGLASPAQCLFFLSSCSFCLSKQLLSAFNHFHQFARTFLKAAARRSAAVVHPARYKGTPARHLQSLLQLCVASPRSNRPTVRQLPARCQQGACDWPQPAAVQNHETFPHQQALGFRRKTPNCPVCSRQHFFEHRQLSLLVRLDTAKFSPAFSGSTGAAR